MNEIQFEGEAFKIIDGFKNYAVSKSGKVLSIRKKIVLKKISILIKKISIRNLFWYTVV